MGRKFAVIGRPSKEWRNYSAGLIGKNGVEKIRCSIINFKITRMPVEQLFFDFSEIAIYGGHTGHLTFVGA